LKIATLKETTTSARTLLGSDPTKPADYTVPGVPILATPAITTNDLVWAIPRSRVVVAMRQDVTLKPTGAWRFRAIARHCDVSFESAGHALSRLRLRRSRHHHDQADRALGPDDLRGSGRSAAFRRGR
jgi:hypothetical protein